jgi:hypothetical protein
VHRPSVRRWVDPRVSSPTNITVNRCCSSAKTQKVTSHAAVINIVFVGSDRKTAERTTMSGYPPPPPNQRFQPPPPPGGGFGPPPGGPRPGMGFGPPPPNNGGPLPPPGGGFGPPPPG